MAKENRLNLGRNRKQRKEREKDIDFTKDQKKKEL